MFVFSEWREREREREGGLTELGWLPNWWIAVEITAMG